ncbi:MAG: YraN family protein [bacterium]|nr:YraN family protein [bacterium]
MNTKDFGNFGEDSVTNYLTVQGFKILNRNWKTRWCEIDIVAHKEKTVYFVEVKFRNSNNWGDGLEYITPKKQKQMRFAAEMWMQTNQWQGYAQLSAASVDSNGTIDFIKDINS